MFQWHSHLGYSSLYDVIFIPRTLSALNAPCGSTGFLVKSSGSGEYDIRASVLRSLGADNLLLHRTSSEDG